MLLAASCYDGGLLGLGRVFPATDFDGGHAFFVDLLLRGDWGLELHRMAWPVGSIVRYIGFAMVPLAAPGWLIADISVGYLLGLWLSVGLSAGVATWLLRRLSGLDAWACGALALPVALSPFVLGSLAYGQMAKVQIWLTLLCLAALVALRPGRHLVGSLVLFAVAAFTSLNSPSVGLSLPFVAGAVVLAQLPRWRELLGTNALRLGLTALALVPTWLYHRSGFPSPDTLQMPAPTDPIFALTPSMRVGPLGTPTRPLPVAEPVDLLLGLGQRDLADLQIHHVTYLLLPLLGLAIWGLLRARDEQQLEPRRLGAGLLLMGAVLSLGPVLAWGPDYVQVGGYLVPLPAMLLEWLSYPLSESGQYYRLVSLAYIGAALLGALGLASLSVGRARGLACLLSLLSLGDAWRSTRTLLPIECTPIPGREVYREMAADPEPGAVLELPFFRTLVQSDRALLRAAMSDRSTSLFPLIVNPDAQKHLLQLHGDVRDALGSDEAHARLAELGLRYVVFDPSIGPLPKDEGDGQRSREAYWMMSRPIQEPELRRGLGAPTHEGELLVWRIER